MSRRESPSPERIQEWVRKYEAGKTIQRISIEDGEWSTATVRLRIAEHTTIRSASSGPHKRKANSDKLRQWQHWYDEYGLGYSQISILEHGKYSSKMIGDRLKGLVEPRPFNWHRTKEGQQARERFIALMQERLKA